MLPFKLGSSIVLVVTGVFSAAILYYTQPRQVKLEYEPVENGSDDAPRDPFDILEPEDTVDGYPIAPAEFWKQMRLIKFFMYVPHVMRFPQRHQRR